MIQAIYDFTELETNPCLVVFMTDGAAQQQKVVDRISETCAYACAIQQLVEIETA
jgi:hypothetical protein